MNLKAFPFGANTKFSFPIIQYFLIQLLLIVETEHCFEADYFIAAHFYLFQFVFFIKLMEKKLK